MDDMEMMRSSQLERKKMRKLHAIAMLPLVCVACGPVGLVLGGFGTLLPMALMALWMFGTPFGVIIGPLVLNLRKDLYIIPEYAAMANRVKIFAILDIVFGVLGVLIVGGMVLLGA